MDNVELSLLVAQHARHQPRTCEGIDAVRALENVLKDEPEFAKPFKIVSGRGAHGWRPQFAAQAMLSMVRNGRSPEEAVAWLRKALSIGPARGGAMKLLSGVESKQQVALTDEIVLLPFAEIPASSPLGWIVAEHERASEFPLIHGSVEVPSAALFRPGIIESLFRESSEDLSTKAPVIWFNDLDDAARLLALVPKTVPLEVAHWCHYGDPDVALLGNWGLSRGGPEIRPAMFSPPVEIRAMDVAGVFAAYRQLKKGDQRRIDLALERMIRSRCQFVSGNRAIDLAIALEVLFMNADRDEHSYKISLRAARLTKEDVQERYRVHKLVKCLYDM